MQKPKSYEEMEHEISKVLSEAKKIRQKSQAKYGFHFIDNYDEFGPLGFRVNDEEISARLKTLSESYLKAEDKRKWFVENRDTLRNVLYDKLNFCALFLYYLENTYWNDSHPPRIASDSYPKPSYASPSKVGKFGKKILNDIVKTSPSILPRELNEALRERDKTHEYVINICNLEDFVNPEKVKEQLKKIIDDSFSQSWVD